MGFVGHSLWTTGFHLYLHGTAGGWGVSILFDKNITNNIIKLYVKAMLTFSMIEINIV